MGRLSGSFQYKHRLLIGGRQMVKEEDCEDGNRVRFEDVALLTLRMEEGSMSQGMQAVSRSRKRQWIEMDSPLQPPEGI